MTSPKIERARLRTALVGCGRIGERHARILASAPESELVGLSDVHRKKAEAYAGRHGGRRARTSPE